MRRAAFILSLIAILVLAAATRMHNRGEVFVEGRIYFSDPDCYSRMTRARMVDEGKGWFIHRHDFENYPKGVTPHTTAPLDWAIVGLRRIVDATGAIPAASVLRGQTLDLAGALVAPLFGVLACLSLALVLPRSAPGDGARNLAGAAVLAISPIVVHGTQLGRPDHHGPLILLLAFALAAEVRLLRAPSRAWAIAGGIAWGIAWWISLYEPPILFAIVLGALALANRPAFKQRERWAGWAVFAGVFLISVLIDGWRVSVPDPAMREYFQRWSATIGELRSLSENWPLALGWLGWLCLLVPAALAWHARRDSESRWLLSVLAATAALAIWQIRWGYFLGVVCALAVPAALASLSTRRWIAWLVFAAALWPVARDWDARLYPDEREERRRYVSREEQKALRAIADIQLQRNAGPFIAAWWQSPALAYWSRQPGVAGSSHESLPGIVDVSRIYLSPDAATALPILQERGAAWMLSDEPERLVESSAILLGVEPPGACLAHELNRHFDSAPWTPSVLPDSGVPRPFGNHFFQVWRVQTVESRATLPK